MNPGQMAMELRLAICNLTALDNLPPRRVCSVGSFASRRGLGETWSSKPQRCGDLRTKVRPLQASLRNLRTSKVWTFTNKLTAVHLRRFWCRSKVKRIFLWYMELPEAFECLSWDDCGTFPEWRASTDTEVNTLHYQVGGHILKFLFWAYFSKGIAGNDQQRRQRMVVAAAFPTALSAAVTLVVVGAAVATILKNKEKLQSLEVAKEECGECNGSGLCPACNGEGFLLKNLTPEAAAKARSRAVDAATRYTAGLAKKWSYCSTCSGTRSCPACRGQGFIDD